MKQRDEVSVLEKKDRHRQNRRNQLRHSASPNTHHGLFLRGPFTVSVSPVCVSGCRDFGRGAGGRQR